MIDPNEELRLLELEFPHSSRAFERDTSASLDERILSIGRRHAAGLAAEHLQKQSRREEKARAAREYIPKVPPKKRGGRPAFRVQADLSKFGVDRIEKAASRASKILNDNLPRGAAESLQELQGSSQQVWLDHIADHMRTGDIELASYLLRRYRRAFPGGGTR